MNPRTTAIVHEWLTDWGGSEDVTRTMLNCIPEAELFATIEFLSDSDRRKLAARTIHTTFLQRVPAVRRHFWRYLPLTPLAVESHDLGDAELVVSSSHAFAKGVLTRADQLHVSYVHSPMRYAWDLHHEYLRDYKLGTGVKGLLARYVFHRLRQWDRQTANNVDLFLANSRHVQRRVWRTYRRPSLVLYPPVATGRFALQRVKEDHYVTVSRLVSYKRIDLIIEAFRRLPSRKLIVIGDGPEAGRLRQICPPNVTMAGRQSDEAVASCVGAARAFVFAAHEDFGISPVEAQACGTPVIAYGAGGALETVRDARNHVAGTGLLFPRQTPESLAQAVEVFESMMHRIDPQICSEWAQTFDESRFRDQFMDCIDRAWDAWRRDPAQLESAALGPSASTLQAAR